MSELPDPVTGLHVNRIKITHGEFHHDCPKYFDPNAPCSGSKDEDCNVSSVLDSVFDMYSYEEDFYFMK